MLDDSEQIQKESLSGGADFLKFAPKLLAGFELGALEQLVDPAKLLVGLKAQVIGFRKAWCRVFLFVRQPGEFRKRLQG